MIFIFFYLSFFSQDSFYKLEEILEKIRKTDTLYNLKMDIEFYKREVERIKKENNFKEVEKLKGKMEFDFNTALKNFYFSILSNLEENLSFFNVNENLEEYKNFKEEINLRVVKKEELEDFNNEILKKLTKIYKTFKDPCPEYYQKAENSKDLKTKIENYCNIYKNPCLFSPDLKEFVRNKLEEEKFNFLTNLRGKNKLSEVEEISDFILKCSEKDEIFLREVDKLRKEFLKEVEEKYKKKDCKDFKTLLHILKILRVEEVYPEKFFTHCEKEFVDNKIEKDIKGIPEMTKKVIVDESINKVDPYIVLDIWQSAWGDFGDINLLLDYIKKNKISEINLNIGKEITGDKKTKIIAKDILKDISEKLYMAGIKKINLLYAELNYAIENYAEFLSLNQDLKIEKIVDDSEFTDKNWEKYLLNSSSVNKFGLKYSVFVTLEREGNSGVSDKTRFYLIEKADEVILMSYFTCNLEEQKKWLLPYFEYSDKIGKKRNLKVAILFGSKSVGREVSCEKLSREALKELIFGLHTWALNFSSYSGIVFESNKKIPPDFY